MGAGISMAQGLHHAEPDTLHFAFIGDSTFFHTGIPGLINAVTNAADIIVAILDNSTTAMTGGQPHPGIGRTAAGDPAPKINIGALVAALGVDVERVNAFDLDQAKDTVTRAIEKKGVRVILFEGACVNDSLWEKPYLVNPVRCTGCKACVSRLGCPALSIHDKQANIDHALCTGCGLCARVCAFDAIERGDDV
jgi:indolepyruvate ferredoxin oxidoreductase alpha subunit